VSLNRSKAGHRGGSCEALRNQRQLVDQMVDEWVKDGRAEAKARRGSRSPLEDQAAWLLALIAERRNHREMELC
jgi:hypothetical protein